MLWDSFPTIKILKGSLKRSWGKALWIFSWKWQCSGKKISNSSSFSLIFNKHPETGKLHLFYKAGLYKFGKLRRVTLLFFFLSLYSCPGQLSPLPHHSSRPSEDKRLCRVEVYSRSLKSTVYSFQIFMF